MTAHADWSWQQLAELLTGVGDYTDEQSAIEGALKLAAVAVDAEMGAVVTASEVRATLGFRRGRAPDDLLLRLADEAPDNATMPGVGRCALTVVALEDDPPGVLLLARREAAFDAAELTLVRGMCRVLILALRPLRLLETERALRREGERQSADNARLLAEVRERQAFLERLTDIQQAISRRQPIQEVLDAIALGVAECIGDEIVILRVIDEDDPDVTRVAASVGTEGLGAATSSRAWSGISGQATTTGALVVAEDYATAARGRAALVAAGIRSSMACPVHRNGTVAGALVVATRARRSYAQQHRQALEVFAEHVSLALNDASAQRIMRRAYDAAVEQARHDALTGLPNRTQVLEQLDAHGSGGIGGSVVFIDLDRFKAINDSLGHPVGDEVLVALAGRLQAAVRPGDVVGRLAGDEFVAVCPGLDAEDAVGLAERLAATVAEPLVLGDRRVVVTASVGVSTAVGDIPGEDVLRDADSAMYRAKEHGSGRVEVFDAAMRTQALERLDLEQALRTAGVDGELELHYQPILDARTGTPWAVEALLRWDRAGVGAVRPDVFIPVAEEAGLIEPIGTWAIETACAEVARWRRECAPLAALRLNVNLSANQLASPGLVATVAHALAQTGLPGAALFLELTESALMRDVERSGATLAELRQLGVRLSIDDFGTGYSSLVYLKRFVVSELKIDRSFVGGLGADAEDDAIVRAVIGLAHSLRLRAVAEGVVTVAQLAALRQLGCDAVQGFLLCRPAPAAGALAWLQEAATGAPAGPCMPSADVVAGAVTLPR